MIKKIILLGILLLTFSSLAWALTNHADYATMEIKDCNACHKSSGVTFNHGSMWMDEHRILAEKKPNNCKDCHNQSFCLDCHTGGGIDADLHVSNFGADYKPRSHRTDFRELHPLKALDDPRSCYRCHDAKRFCNECHSKFSFNRLDFSFVSHAFSDIDVNQVGTKHTAFTNAQCQNCHPKLSNGNVLLPKLQWSTEHGREARRNIASCQTCHPEGDVCMKCHSATTGLQVNPHPKNWGRISGRLQKASNNRTCVKCH